MFHSYTRNTASPLRALGARLVIYERFEQNRIFLFYTKKSSETSQAQNYNSDAYTFGNITSTSVLVSTYQLINTNRLR